MLFKRYSNPFPLITNLIRCRRLFEFIKEFIQIRNEELDYQATWECWLHKDYEHSFTEFREQIKTNERIQNMDSEEKMKIVRESNDILSSFVPTDEI